MLYMLKIQKQFADDILEGKKTFEIRYDERPYKVGDLINFNKVLDSNGDLVDHEISNRLYRINYLLTAKQVPGGLEEDYVIFGIEGYQY